MDDKLYSCLCCALIIHLTSRRAQANLNVGDDNFLLHFGLMFHFFKQTILSSIWLWGIEYDNRESS